MEAIVGFPFSCYGSIRWSREFHDAVNKSLLAGGLSGVEFGELTSIALSFHMFEDLGDQEIARAIVTDAAK